MLSILTVVGARPQFIKAAPVGRALRHAGHREFLVHTGQHYDREMSEIFFEELKIPKPDLNLEIGSGSHGKMTGQMLIRLEEVLMAQKPDWVLVYGDTNSTLAGALAACKLGIPLAHVEAGLRSFNRSMPEEHNRVVADHLADCLFCPTQTAVKNLEQEGIRKGVHQVGDTMLDAVLAFKDLAAKQSTVLARLKAEPGKYLLATIHRPYNTDVPEALREILAALEECGEAVVFPVHPRTRKCLGEMGYVPPPALTLIEPVGYLDMLMLQQHARLILTDSGGMQKEAFFLGIPCITLRPETEWVETVAAGWNILTGADREKILAAIRRRVGLAPTPPPLFGDGIAAEKIVAILASI